MKIEETTSSSDLRFNITASAEEFNLELIFNAVNNADAAIAIIELPNKKFLVWLKEETYSFGSVKDFGFGCDYMQSGGVVKWDNQYENLNIKYNDNKIFFIRTKTSGDVCLTGTQSEQAVQDWRTWRNSVTAEKSKIITLKVLIWK